MLECSVRKGVTVFFKFIELKLFLLSVPDVNDAVRYSNYAVFAVQLLGLHNNPFITFNI